MDVMDKRMGRCMVTEQHRRVMECPQPAKGTALAMDQFMSGGIAYLPEIEGRCQYHAGPFPEGEGAKA